MRINRIAMLSREIAAASMIGFGSGAAMSGEGLGPLEDAARRMKDRLRELQMELDAIEQERLAGSLENAELVERCLAAWKAIKDLRRLFPGSGDSA